VDGVPSTGTNMSTHTSDTAQRNSAVAMSALFTKRYPLVLYYSNAEYVA
jgi:hypothetical protein